MVCVCVHMLARQSYVIAMLYWGIIVKQFILKISIWLMWSGTKSKHCLAPDADDNDPMHADLSAWPAGH